MNDKTIKELAVELTVETTVLCDNIKGRSVFINQLLRLLFDWSKFSRSQICPKHRRFYKQIRNRTKRML